MTSGASGLIIRSARIRRTPRTEESSELYVRDGVFADAMSAVDAEVIEAHGASAVPLTVDSAVAERPASEKGIYDLVPGNPATFALVRRAVSEAQIRRMLVIDPGDLIAAYVDGHREVWRGTPTRPAGEDVEDPATGRVWLGAWEDPARGLVQHLLPGGRYTETRGGRENAYTGRYWVRDGRITYLDDSGFWAFGELLFGTLHHAGFVMTRAESSR